MLALILAIPTAHPLLLGIPIDMDAARQLYATPLLCWRCQKPEHFAQHCPLGLEHHTWPRESPDLFSLDFPLPAV
ncbi:hypothetical protein E4T56_gene14191 [Termitomyces sp. T112]|nr:hypothetical protein E4T56_gene14191 [Termitomyces sp. T112]